MIRVLIYVVVALIIYIVVRILYKETRIDGLTGIKNKRALIRKTRNYDLKNKEYSVIMLDIDDFKNVNDTYGHEYGDVVLSRIAELLRQYESNSSKAYRYGGEEFVILSDINQLYRAVDFAEYIRTGIAGMNWEKDLHITVSLGVSMSVDSDSPVESADENLYYSKSHGKNVTTYIKNGKKNLAKQGE